jgi:hypothetical protein
MAELITVPTFTFNQGDPFDYEIISEYPITVKYYSNEVELVQNGKTIIIRYEFLDSLFKEIKKHKKLAIK